MRRDSCSTAGDASVHVGDSISTVGDSISTVEAVQYCGGIASVLRRLFSTAELSF